MSRAQKSRSGFTLAEMVTVLGIAMTLMMFAARGWGYCQTKLTEAQLRRELRAVRGAEERCYADTGLYVDPASLASSSAPTSGYRGAGGNTLGVAWTTTTLVSGRWRGPYLDHVPTDPITGAAFTLNPASASSVTAGSAVFTTSTQTGSDGIAYLLY